MTSYFEDPHNFIRLLAELAGWRGTPFIPGIGKKGQGADCVRFVEAVLVNLGAIAPVPFPKYVTRGGGEEMLRIFIETMDAIPRMKKVWLGWGYDEQTRPEAIRGDVLLVSSGRALHHLAIVSTPPVVWHCLEGVVEANLYDPIVERHLRAIYRVKP